MKKYLLFTGMVFLFCVPVIAQLSVKIRGSLSKEIENTGKEMDPVPTLKLLPQAAVFSAQLVANNATQTMAAIPEGLQITQKAIGRLIANEYKFSLLSSHKYMVNDCLGIKVSTGEFGVKFRDPGVTYTSDGNLRIKLKIDRITMSGFKLRMRPRAPDFSDPNPCHFSGKFEVGGSAKDLSVTILLSPILMTYTTAAMAPQWCLIGYNNPPSLDWAMDALDLAGLANTYYHSAKEMMFDALDFGLNKLLIEMFILILREEIKIFYSECNTAMNILNNTVTVSSGNVQSTGTSPENIGNPVKEDSAFNIKSNNVKGATGRLVMNNPAGSIWTIYIYRMSDNKYITSYAHVNNKGVISLAPGMYKITLNDAPVLNVEIKKEHDTHLKTGVLDVQYDDVWYLYDGERKNTYTSGNKPTKLLLPVGRYTLEEGGGSRVVEVKEEKKATLSPVKKPA